MHKIFTPNKFSHNLLRPFEVLTSSVVTSCVPGEALKKTTFFCFVLWILEMVQLLAGQCCLQVSASVKQVKLQPPPVQFCWQFKPWHSNEQFPELHSWTHGGESHMHTFAPSFGTSLYALILSLASHVAVSTLRASLLACFGVTRLLTFSIKATRLFTLVSGGTILLAASLAALVAIERGSAVLLAVTVDTVLVTHLGSNYHRLCSA